MWKRYVSNIGILIDGVGLIFKEDLGDYRVK